MARQSNFKKQEKGEKLLSTLLLGVLVFAAALVMDRLMLLFEPITTGWFTELGGFALVLAMGAAIRQEVARQYRDKAVFAERAKNTESP